MTFVLDAVFIMTYIYYYINNKCIIYNKNYYLEQGIESPIKTISVYINTESILNTIFLPIIFYYNAFPLVLLYKLRLLYKMSRTNNMIYYDLNLLFLCIGIYFFSAKLYISQIALVIISYLDFFIY